MCDRSIQFIQHPCDITPVLLQERFQRRFNELKKKLASNYDERVEDTVKKLEQEFKAQLKTNPTWDGEDGGCNTQGGDS